MSVIIIDPGHGGKDSGAAYHGLKESDMALKIAEHCVRALDSRGHDVKMTRIHDMSIGLSERAKIANDARSDVFVSIHLNAFHDESVDGMECYCFPGSKTGKRLTRHIHGAIRQAFSAQNNRGVKEANFAVLRETAMPASLVECCFISNPVEAKWISNNVAQQGFGLAIAFGIQGYINSCED